MADRRSRPTATGLVAPRVPHQVLALVGVTTAGFAAALAGVSGLQAADEARQAAIHEPVLARLDDIAAAREALAGRIRAIDAGQSSIATTYDGVANGLPTLDATLGQLSIAVKAVDGAARAMPRSVALPPVVRSTRPSTTSGRTHATTGGSAVP